MSGDEDNHNCTECKENYIYEIKDGKYFCNDCHHYLYLNSENELKCTDDDNCPN